jgi:hypothetical protein
MTNFQPSELRRATSAVPPLISTSLPSAPVPFRDQSAITKAMSPLAHLHRDGQADGQELLEGSPNVAAGGDNARLGNEHRLGLGECKHPSYILSVEPIGPRDVQFTGVANRSGHLGPFGSSRPRNPGQLLPRAPIS